MRTPTLCAQCHERPCDDDAPNAILRWLCKECNAENERLDAEAAAKPPVYIDLTLDSTRFNKPSRGRPRKPEHP